MNEHLQKTEAKRDIRDFIQSPAMKAQLAMALPKHITPDRMARVALTAIMRSPKLMSATQESLLNCLMQCSQLGLEPDGRRAHLIPFENRAKGTVECTLIIDWKGLAELALRGGTIAKLHADVICDKDEFAYDLGDILHHRINFREPRGKPFAAYAMAVTKTGEKFVQVMTQAEIEAIRDNSQGWRSFKSGYAKQSPWQDAEGEMWKKTVFRRLSKWLPLSPEYRDAIEVDDETQPQVNIEPAAVAFPALPDFSAPALAAPAVPTATATSVVPEPAKTKPARKPRVETPPAELPLTPHAPAFHDTTTQPEPFPGEPLPPKPEPELQPDPAKSLQPHAGVPGMFDLMGAIEAAGVTEKQVLNFFNKEVRPTAPVSEIAHFPINVIRALTDNLKKHADPTNGIVKTIRAQDPI